MLMLKADALAYYEDNQSQVARALQITRASVNGWPAVVPLRMARALEIVTGGRLRVDETLYPILRTARETVAKGAQKQVRT